MNKALQPISQNKQHELLAQIAREIKNKEK